MNDFKTLQDILLGMEQEMRKLGLWETVQPPLEALQSPMPFCYDTLRFPQWLQWVFIPRCGQILRTREGVPQSSDIHPLAEYYFDEAGIEAQQLLAQIERFDALISCWNTRQGEIH
jgi:uncharacterized protein YqcC (DUF446 family)